MNIENTIDIDKMTLADAMAATDKLALSFMNNDNIIYTTSFTRYTVIKFKELDSDKFICSLNYKTKIIHIIDNELFNKYFSKNIYETDKVMLSICISELVENLKELKLIKKLSEKELSESIKSSSFNNNIKGTFNNEFMYYTLFEGITSTSTLKKLVISKTLIFNGTNIVESFKLNFFNKIGFQINNESEVDINILKIKLIATKVGSNRSFASMKYTGKSNAGLLINYYLNKRLNDLGIESNLYNVLDSDVYSIYEIVKI